MRINADFSKRAVVHSADMDWVSSPMLGVDRRMLDRDGAEAARATTVVRYAPGSAFSAHTHGGGEEFLVLDGIFQDEHGDFPVGSYVRNPPTSHHTPRSDDGCTILVKLQQFEPNDRTHVRIASQNMASVTLADRPGVRVIPLFNDGREDVRLEHWDPNSTIELQAPGGLEVFVLSGGFEETGETFRQHSWLRLPKHEDLKAMTGDSGAKVWIKTGHLEYLDFGQTGTDQIALHMVRSG